MAGSKGTFFDGKFRCGIALRYFGLEIEAETHIAAAGHADARAVIDAVLAQAIDEVGKNFEVDAVAILEEVIGMDFALGMEDDVAYVARNI